MNNILLAMLALSSPSFDKRMDLAEYSFITGCYAGALSFCPTNINPDKCYELALQTCPKRGNLYKEWLKKGPK